MTLNQSLTRTLAEDNPRRELVAFVKANWAALQAGDVAANRERARLQALRDEEKTAAPKSRTPRMFHTRWDELVFSVKEKFRQEGVMAVTTKEIFAECRQVFSTIKLSTLLVFLIHRGHYYFKKIGYLSGSQGGKQIVYLPTEGTCIYE